MKGEISIHDTGILITLEDGRKAAISMQALYDMMIQYSKKVPNYERGAYFGFDDRISREHFKHPITFTAIKEHDNSSLPHEDMGNVMWFWRNDDPPYVGQMADCDSPGEESFYAWCNIPHPSDEFYSNWNK